MSRLSVLGRLASQLEALPTVLGQAAAEELRRRPASGKWSVHENLAHLARHHDVFLQRLRRILDEASPVLPQYRAEDDPLWPQWAALPTDEVLARLQSLRAELVASVERLSEAELARTGVHSRFGPLSLAAWIEFFLVHEAHHLYTMFKRARGDD
jgi:uncharacterized damage-inducible protein DinB